MSLVSYRNSIREQSLISLSYQYPMAVMMASNEVDLATAAVKKTKT